MIDALHDELVAQGLIDEVQVLETSRIGDPVLHGPDMMVYPEGVHYASLTADDIPFLVEEHFLKGRVVEKFRAQEQHCRSMKSWARPKPRKCASCCATAVRSTRSTSKTISPKMATWPWPESSPSMTPEETLDMIKRSGLRGRGGAGFSAGKKWELCPQGHRTAPST